MNLKLAKKLRKMAKEIAAQSPEPLQMIDYRENQLARKKYPTQERDEMGIPMTNADGTPKMTWVEYTVGTITHSLSSISGIYRDLKRQYKMA